MGCCYPVGENRAVQVPPDQSLANRSGANSTCQPSNGRTKLEGARRQAASLSPAICRVVDSRIAAAVARQKPIVCKRRQAAVLVAVRQVRRTPPGSKRLFEKSSIGGISSVHCGDECQPIPYRPH